MQHGLRLKIPAVQDTYSSTRNDELFIWSLVTSQGPGMLAGDPGLGQIRGSVNVHQGLPLPGSLRHGALAERSRY